MALAELHIPICNTDSDRPVRDSKCGALGVGSSGLPPWWFDNNARSVAPERLPEPFSFSADACAPSLHVALQWCTDIPNEDGSPLAKYRAYRGEYVNLDPVDCGAHPLYGPSVGGPSRWRERTARLLVEAGPTRADWLFPMATAYPSALEGDASPNRAAVAQGNGIDESACALSINHQVAPLAEAISAQGFEGLSDRPIDVGLIRPVPNQTSRKAHFLANRLELLPDL